MFYPLNSACNLFCKLSIIFSIILFTSSSVKVLSIVPNDNEYAILLLSFGIFFPSYTSNISIFVNNEPADFFITFAI